MSPELRLALSVAEEAADLALSGFRAGTRVSKKGRIDLVTEHDLACEALIRERIQAEFPNDRIVAEESDATGTGNRVWYVDPIDGTTNFAHGSPMFGVSVALYLGNVGQVGVICAPALGVTWSASVNDGCFRVSKLEGGEPTRCLVSKNDEFENCLVATGFPYDRVETGQNNVPELETLLMRSRGVRRGGSAAIDLAMVADGTFDFYWERNLNPWDIGAGCLMVTEAGGRLTQLDGGAPDLASGNLIASNGLVHDAGIGLLKDSAQQ